MKHSSLLFESALPAPVLAFLFGVFLTLAVLSYRKTTRPLPSGVRAFLTLLRLGAVLLALLGLLRPVSERRQSVEMPKALPVIVDASRSLDILDGEGKVSRERQLKEIFARLKGPIDRLEGRFDVQYFEFDRSVERVIRPTFRTDGTVSALARALEDVLVATRGMKLAGVLVISDGVRTGDRELSVSLGSLTASDIPVYTIGLGRDIPDESHRDAAVLSAKAKSVAFARTEIPIKGEYSFLGLAGSQALIRASADGAPFDEMTLPIPTGTWRKQVTFSYFPPSPGARKITLRVEPLKGELILSNNELSTYVNVISGGLSVAFLEASVRPEIAFLKRTLAESRELRAEFILKRTQRDGGDELPADLLKTFDVIVIGDLPAAHLSGDEAQAITEAVSQGAGLIMLASRRSFGVGGYANAGIGELIPVDITGSDRWVDDLVELHLTDAGLRHPALTLVKDVHDNTRLWNSLPECLGHMVSGKTKATSEVLAEDARGRPLIVTGRYGLGRTAAVMVDSTWRWVLSETDTASIHQRFWQQFLLFAGGRDAPSGNRLWIEMPEYAYPKDSPVFFEVHAEDENGDFPEGLRLRVTHERPDGRLTELSVNKAPDGYVGLARPDSPGDHEIRVKASLGEEEFGSTNARFLVYLSDAEFEQLAADFSVLRTLSEKTGGRFQPAANAHRIIEDLTGLPHTTTVERASRKDLWNSHLVYALIALFLCTEWLVRKKFSMP